jgi:Prion-inhibition and propagation
LGAIEYVFQNSEKLQDSYGLRPMDPAPQQPESANEPPTQSQLILGSIFTRASNTLRRLAKDRQRETSLRKRTIWAVHDGKRFQKMVLDIKGFIDNLESLFPNTTGDVLENLRIDIDRSEDVGALQSLQEATTNEHEEISETASSRLEALGATSVARSHVSGGASKVVREDDASTQDVGCAKNGEVSELEKEMQAVDLYVRNKTTGALIVTLLGPHSYSARVTAGVHWEGEKYGGAWRSWNDRDKGFVRATHASFGESLSASNFKCQG